MNSEFRIQNSECREQELELQPDSPSRFRRRSSVVGRRSLVVDRLLRDERGIELIEFLGFFPLVLMVIVISWQIILVGYTGVVAAGAAREGARAAVVRSDVGSAVRFASPGFDGRRSHTVSGFCSDYSGNPVQVRVQLQVPHTVIPFLGAISYPNVSATATMRCEPPYNAR